MQETESQEEHLFNENLKAQHHLRLSVIIGIYVVVTAYKVTTLKTELHIENLLT